MVRYPPYLCYRLSDMLYRFMLDMEDLWEVMTCITHKPEALEIKITQIE